MTKRKIAIKSYAESSEEEETEPLIKEVDKKRKKSETSDESDSEPEISAYEQLRLKNIEEREKLLRSLGIDNAIKELNEITPAKKKYQPKSPRIKLPKEPLPLREPSRRIRNLAADSEKKIKLEVENDLIEEEEIDSRFRGSIPMKCENDESEELFKKFEFLSTNIKQEPEVDLKHCDVKSFQNCMMCLRMTGEAVKVVPRRIQSILAHPTITKQLAIVGDSSGYLGLWDLEVGYEKSAATFKVHNGPLNCISVSSTDATKIFTTGHDGAFVCADLENKLFSNLYSTDFNQRYQHLTWHDQVDANRLLLTHGNGCVGVLDLRENNSVNTWIPCFDRSARTVQHHPLKDNYFLVSSGAGFSCNVYDIRSCSNKKAEPISEMPHPKGLTSAFFSPSGDLVLSTCNDDSLRIYSSPLDIKPRMDRKISHNNHTGRWLSVFKAMWHPARNDVFMIGSLLSPRRIQLYGLKGTMVAELRSEEMTTITPVISAHPTLPFIVGGNSSGRVFPFRCEI